MKKILFIILAFASSDAFSQITPIFSDESTCFKYRTQALKEYESNGFTFDLVDSNVTFRDLYIDSLAKSKYNMTIERFETLPYEVCGTAMLEMECYYDIRDSIYEAKIGHHYLDRLVENLGLEYDVLQGKNIDSVYHNYPDSCISIDKGLISEMITSISSIINDATLITIEIKSNYELKLEEISYNIKRGALTQDQLRNIEKILTNFESKLTINKSAVDNGKKVNSNYELNLFIRPKK